MWGARHRGIVTVAAVTLSLAAPHCNRQPAPPPEASVEAGVTKDVTDDAGTKSKPAPAPPVQETRPPPIDPFTARVAERDSMVDEQIARRGVNSSVVLQAMRRVPRHAFVPANRSKDAYRDRPLPIGDGQTISQPFIVAYMTAAVAPNKESKCLEIGTGSGYQAAVLAEICKEVYSIEYLAPVAAFGKKNLRKLGYDDSKVHLRVGDGYKGWPEAAPFDVIVVTAAPERVPPPLLEQLAVGGRLVIPVGTMTGGQQLEVWRRQRAGSGKGALVKTDYFPVRFVPFLGPGKDSKPESR